MSKHALIVNPNSERFEVFRDIFRTEGISVEWAQNGLSACEYVQSHTDIGFVVTELSLPGVDGFRVLKTLAQTSNAGVPVLVASAFHAMLATAAEMRQELGISDLLPASTAPESLRMTIQRLLRHEVVTVEMPRWSASRAAELKRLRSLERSGARRSTGHLDKALQAIVERVAADFQVPIAALSLVLEDRQWFKIRTGTDLEETPLDRSFCRHVVEAQEPLVVPDATVNPTFANNPLVAQKVVRGYAGAPLIGSDGEVWGALCIIDPVNPLQLTPADMEKLIAVARLVAAQLEERPGAHEPART
jgi:CheY-like chemotaxis protein